MTDLNTLIDQAHAAGLLIAGIGEWPAWKHTDLLATNGWAANLIKPDTTSSGWIWGATPEEALVNAIAKCKPAPAAIEDIFG